MLLIHDLQEDLEVSIVAFWHEFQEQLLKWRRMVELTQLFKNGGCAPFVEPALSA